MDIEKELKEQSVQIAKTVTTTDHLKQKVDALCEAILGNGNPQQSLSAKVAKTSTHVKVQWGMIVLILGGLISKAIKLW